jgi:hypothetical protein
MLTYAEWARCDVYIQSAQLAFDTAQFRTAEKALDKALKSCAPHDITAQARVLDEMMDLYRLAGEMRLQARDLRCMPTC